MIKINNDGIVRQKGESLVKEKTRCPIRNIVSRGRFLSCFCFLLLMVPISGCGNKFFDPTQIGRFRPVPSVNVILDSLGVAEEAPVAWEEAEEPRPIDTKVTISDYSLRAGDVVRVSIFELLQEGVQFANDYVVTETGKMSIPEVGIVEAAGLTETQLEDEIKRILSPNILKQPSVTVSLVGSQQRTFSVLGEGVPSPGRFVIPRYGFRLTDALAMSGGPKQFNVSNIYISRFMDNNGRISGEEINPGFGELEIRTVEPETSEPKEVVTPVSKSEWPRSNVVISSSEMVTEGESVLLPQGNEKLTPDESGVVSSRPVRRSRLERNVPEATDEPASVEDVLNTLSQRSRSNMTVNGEEKSDENRADERLKLEEELRASISSADTGATIPEDSEQNGHIEWVFKDGKWIAVRIGQGKAVEEETKESRIEWIFQDGKWVPVQVGPDQKVEPLIRRPQERRVVTARKEPVVPDSGLEKEGVRTRLIKVPVIKLLAGDSRYNIVIKPGDSIFVPVDIIGEFYIGGNVNQTGTIALTGRPMTLKQAIVAAGGLGPLAWPKRCEVIRRIDRKKEEIVMVDLDKIASGEQPDFFIKPNDLINVGTHATSRWRAILRNAFRATYGFGFVYDRNFADRDYGTRRPIPSWF